MKKTLKSRLKNAPRLSSAAKNTAAGVRNARFNWSKLHTISLICAAVAFILLAFAVQKVLASNAAKEYTSLVYEQKSQLARYLRDLSQTSKSISQETAGADERLLDALEEGRQHIAAIKPTEVRQVAFGEVLSSDYSAALRGGFASRLGTTQKLLEELVTYARYQRELQKALEVPALTAPVSDQASASTSQKAWQEAAAKIAAITTTQQSLQDITARLGNHAAVVAEHLGAIAGLYEKNDLAELQKSQAELEKRLEELRRSAELFDEYRDSLETRLQTTVSHL